MHTLCVDFGTSSIRTALRKDGSALSLALPIAPGSDIDNASIPSAIYIPSGGGEVLFGMKASVGGRSSRRKALLLELSPKSWLGPESVAKIDHLAAEGVPFTRRQLIAGLLAFAFNASRRAAKPLVGGKGGFSFRISHPIWQEHDRVKLAEVYEGLRMGARDEDAPNMKDTMSFSEFESWCAVVSIADKKPSSDVDVKEPVAAMLELFPDVEVNSRTAAFVIDVGAGTIDLGLFSSIIPNKGARVKSKLIPMTPPRSLFGAGDVIDQELLTMVSEKLDEKHANQLDAFSRNIRFQKETLFNTGRLVFRNVDISAEELVRRPRMRTMALNLGNAVTEMLDVAASKFEVQLNAVSHRLERLDVIFAGGGANLEFLKACIQQGVSIGEATLAVSRRTAKTPKNFPVEASRARMAVALGGTADESVWPETEMKPAFRRALSLPISGV
jgi:hypothetical protein